MQATVRRVVTGHDSAGKSVVLSDGPPPQNHPMRGPGVGADFTEVWSTPEITPSLTAKPAEEPNGRPFSLMPPSGHLIRVIDLRPASQGGKRTPMHRTSTLDYVVVIEGEIVLILDDGGETVLRSGDVVVQRGTNHAWENRSDATARAAFLHIDAAFSDDLTDRLPKPLELMR